MIEKLSLDRLKELPETKVDIVLSQLDMANRYGQIPFLHQKSLFQQQDDL